MHDTLEALTVDVADHPPHVTEAVRDGMRAVSEEVPTTAGLPTVDAIVEVLRGRRRTRFDPRPSAESLTEQVDCQYDDDTPLRMLTMWGATKHYVPPAEQGIDLAELWAAQRMAAICDAITAVHPAGAEVTVLVEDLGVWYQDAFGEPCDVVADVETAIAGYVESFRSLLAVVDSRLRPVTFTEVLGGCADDYLDTLERNTELVVRHLDGLDSGAVAPDRALLDAGWRGDLSSATLAHYLRRVQSLHPGEPRRKQLTRVGRFLGTVLLYEQYEWQRATSEHAIRLAFYKPAPGIPTHRLVGRVHARGQPRSSCSTMMPPWTSCGCVVTEADGRTRSHLESFRELARTTTDQSDAGARLARNDREMSFRVRWATRAVG